MSKVKFVCDACGDRCELVVDEDRIMPFMCPWTSCDDGYIEDTNWRAVTTGEDERKARCWMCEKEFETHDLFCLHSLRGATSTCVEDNHVLLCENCLKRFRLRGGDALWMLRTLLKGLGMERHL